MIISDGPYVDPPQSTADYLYERLPVNYSQEFGAMAGEAFSQGLGAVARGTAEAQYEKDGFWSMLGRGMSVAGQAAGGMPGVDPTAGLPGMQRVVTPDIEPKQLKEQYGIESKVSMPQGVAEIVAKEQQDALVRARILFAGEQTFSGPTRFFTGLAASMVDPLNAATAFIPGVGEEAILARLGRSVAGRAVAGGASQAAAMGLAQAPLTALRYGMSREEQTDYSMRDAFGDMAKGMIWGALLGGTGGALFGRRGLDDLTLANEQAAKALAGMPAPVKRDALRSSVAQLLEGQELNVQPVLDEYAVQLAMRQRRLAEAGASFEPQIPPPDIGERATMGARPLEEMPLLNEQEIRRLGEEQALRRQDQGLAGEHAEALRQIHPEALQASDTLARVNAVEQQISQLRELDQHVAEHGEIRDQIRQLSDRRDELLANTTPDKLQEQAASAEPARQLEMRRSNIAARLQELAKEREQARTETALGTTPKLPEQGPPLVPGRAELPTPDVQAPAYGPRQAISRRAQLNRLMTATKNVRAALPTSPDAFNFAKTLAENQARLIREGFQPGMTQNEVLRARNAIYGDEAKAEAEAASTPEGQAKRADTQLAVAANDLQAFVERGGIIRPEDAEALDVTAQNMAGDMDAALQEAATCLKEAAQ